MLSCPLILVLALPPLVATAPTFEAREAGPTVQFSYATVVGSSANGIDNFLGIPYAQPGQPRLKPPQPITSNLGTLQLSTAKACPQFLFQSNSEHWAVDALSYLIDSPFIQSEVTNAGEDCLNLNVQRPSTATKGSNLPVVFWIFGGGFELGSTSMYSGSTLIQESILQKKDVIFVAVNYRVGAFGFLPGKEILQDGSSNLGLLDQRLGMQWVADNIAEFGGDPDKVTIWGESAGALSILDQMLMYDGNHLYKGKPLFRAAIMESGSAIPTQRVDSPKAQIIYDAVVNKAGCSGSNDTLQCLRTIDYDTFLSAANAVPGILSYNSVSLSYLPRPDGKVLTDSPEIMAPQGKYAPVPFIVGDQQDEGTLFSLFQTNLTTTDDLVEYLNTVFFPQAPREFITNLVNLYPDDPSFGSPFGTGNSNSLYPQFKRTAAILGDLVFTITRRVVLNITNTAKPNIPSWSYLATYGHTNPYLGTFHGSDLLHVFGLEGANDFPTKSIMSYYIPFIHTMDPNGGNEATGQLVWPMWKDGNMLVEFGATNNSLMSDTFRDEVKRFIEDPEAQKKLRF